MENKDKWTKLEISTNYKNSDLVENILYNYGEFSFEKEDNRFEMFENIEGHWDYIDEKYFENNDKVVFRVYSQDDENSFKDIKKEVEDRELGEAILSEIDDEDWKNNWKSFYKTIEIGKRIVIKPKWEEYENKDNRIVIELDPGMAFGTGGHETTRLCLEAIEKNLKGNDSVLDMGCGSGILSIASKKLGAGKVLGADYDKKAVEISIENAESEGVDVEYRYSDLFSNIEGTYDLIIANIIAEIVVKLVDELDNYLNEDGIFIASGILEEKSHLVEESLVKNNFEILEKNSENEWVAIIARRKNA